MLGTTLFYMLAKGPNKGRVRPALVTEVHSDKTIDATVFTTRADQVDSTGMLFLRGVKADGFGTDGKSAVVNGQKAADAAAAAAKAEAARIVKAAEKAEKAAESAADDVKAATDKAARLALEAKAAHAEVARKEADAKAAKEAADSAKAHVPPVPVLQPA